MFVIPLYCVEILIPRKAMSGKHVKGRQRNSRMNPFITEEKSLGFKLDCVLINKTLQNGCHTMYQKN